MTIKLTKSQKIKVLNGDDVYRVMRDILLRESKIDRNKEHLWIVSLSNANNILLVELISLGTVKSIQIEPMEVFSFALQKKAVKIIMVHNHTSGETHPSSSDIHITDVMQAIGEFIKVPLIDHLIISEEDYFSFQDSGMLGEIRRKSTYDLNFTQINKLLASIKKLEKKNIGAIKRMLKDGHSPKTIAKYLDLTEKKVNELIKDSK